MRVCYLDTETFSDIPLNYGTAKYALRVEVMVVTYAIDGGPVRCWDCTSGAPIPDDLEDALLDPSVELWAHNSYFDRTVMRHDPKFAMYDLRIERWRCVMVQAYAHALPGALDKLGVVLGLPEDERKLEGRQLIHLFCKPRPKNSELRRATRDTHSKEWAEFLAYAVRDTESMRVVHSRMPTWNYPDNVEELEYWFLDQKINDRGVLCDLELARAAVRATDKAKRNHNTDIAERTDGYVTAATQRDRMIGYLLLDHNVMLPDLTADTLERRINDPDLPDELRELLAIRLDAAMTSQTKYKKAIDAACPDGRIRGTIQFDGAGRTGRYAGRILNPQNFKRPTLKQPFIDMFIEALKNGTEELICA